MARNWAEEFRERVEENESKYRATEDFDDVDESLEEEEETAFEEPRDEAEEEAEEIKEPEEYEAEKPVVVDVGKRVVDMMTAMIGEKAPAKQSGGGNPMGAAVAALMGVLVLQSLPGIFNTMSSAFQPFMGSQSYRGGASPQGYPVRCSACGWTGSGVAGMRCPRCGRS